MLVHDDSPMDNMVLMIVHDVGGPHRTSVSVAGSANECSQSLCPEKRRCFRRWNTQRKAVKTKRFSAVKMKRF